MYYISSVRALLLTTLVAWQSSAVTIKFYGVRNCNGGQFIPATYNTVAGVCYNSPVQSGRFFNIGSTGFSGSDNIEWGVNWVLGRVDSNTGCAISCEAEANPFCLNCNYGTGTQITGASWYTALTATQAANDASLLGGKTSFQGLPLGEVNIIADLGSLRKEKRGVPVYERDANEAKDCVDPSHMEIDGRLFSLANASDDMKAQLYGHWQNGTVTTYSELPQDILDLEDHDANAAERSASAGVSSATESSAATQTDAASTKATTGATTVQTAATVGQSSASSFTA